MRILVMTLACNLLLTAGASAQTKGTQSGAPAIPEASNAPAIDSICDGIANNFLAGYNCGFEYEDFSYFHFYGDTDYSGVDTTNPFTGAYVPNSGTKGAYFGAVGGTTYLELPLSTTGNSTYHLEFWLANLVGGSPSSFEVQWNGQTLMTITDGASFDWTLFPFGPLVGADGISVLTFIFRHDPDWWFLDDVDIEPNPIP